MPNPLAWSDAKILLVDDSGANRLFVRRLLESAGYPAIIESTCGEHALAAHLTEDPDLVILDLHMPGCTGYDVLAQLRARASESNQLPILVFTADSTPQARLKALELGASDFLTKPCDVSEILLRVRNFLCSRRMYRALVNQAVRLEATVAARTEQLADSQAEVLERLGRAAEYRDNETGAHVIRMSVYCAILARAAGLPAEQCEMLTIASTVHDIGKIGVPDSILSKPGKLTAAERAVMQRHVEIGASILENARSELLQTARQIVLSHHEHWDGNGYPQGLKGEAIPIAGRIAAIADVFDALTSERPYKEAWSFERAVKEINDGAGSQFDPNLVGVFNLVLPEFEAVVDGPEIPLGLRAA